MKKQIPRKEVKDMIPTLKVIKRRIAWGLPFSSKERSIIRHIFSRDPW